jgi:hypothetical protein
MPEQAPMMPPQGMAEGGLAGLDVGNMYDEANYATGGIVAFADGGETESNYLDSQAPLNLNTGTQNAGEQGGEEYALKNLMSAVMNQQRGLGVQQPGMEGLLNAFPSKNSNIDYSSLSFPMTPGTNTTPDMIRQALGFAGEMYEKNPSLDFAEGMYGKNRTTKMAQGGEVKRFVKGGTPDEYGIEMPIVPEWDDLKMEQLRAFEQYGVDPDFYAKQAKKLLEERDALKGEKSDAGWMALTRAGLGMAAGTSPFALKNISEGAIQGVTQYGADVKDIKAQDRLLKQADMKLSEAQNAQNRGDAQGALKAMEERKNLLLNAQIEKAKIGATHAKTTASNKRDLFNKARDNAQNAMRDQYGTGGLSAAPFFGDESKWNAELDRKIDKELKFLASEYNVDPSEIKSISSPAAATTTDKPAATTTAKPAASTTPATKPKPTQADIDYVTAHPELRDKFKARFGIDAPSLVNQIPR